MGKILARYVHTQPISGKLFLFDNGVEAFGNSLDEQVKNAGEYARRELDSGEMGNLCGWNPSFTLGLIWGDQRLRTIDLYVYGFKGEVVDLTSSPNWKAANPDVTMWVIREPAGSNVASWFCGSMASCETYLIVLGREAVLRRKTGSLEEYMNLHAYLMDMEPFELYQCLKI